ncbi:MAG TPA: site-2 protease family protein [Candidatus Eisenbacteria bacterium]|nr:site-2 protease family protein [Candidatus Eisenbacteria bacterium]
MTVLEETIRQIALWALPVLTAIVFHEVAHGWVANRLGDPTAARMGRLTLNPLAHIDLFGTVLLPLLLVIANAPFLFGYAKPVPVNYYNLRNPKRDMIWVALAGPVTNLLLALGAVGFLKLALPLFAAGQGSAAGLVDFFAPMALMARNAVIINVVLAVFNILPLPPLDGGRVLVGLLPDPHSSAVARVEPFGFLILIVLLMTRTLDKILGPPMDYLLNLYFYLL